jgi:hypothetical protein
MDFKRLLETARMLPILVRRSPRKEKREALLVVMDAGPYTFLAAADALVLKVREGGRTVNVHALLATGVNADGYREILGLQVTSSEDGAGWLAFFRDLTARGLSGVALVTSDAHRDLVRGNRGDTARRHLATLPHPLRREPHVRDTEVGVGLGESPAAQRP